MNIHLLILLKILIKIGVLAFVVVSDMVERMRCGLATSKTLENRKQKYNVVMAVMEENKVLYRDNCKEIIIKA